MTLTRFLPHAKALRREAELFSGESRLQDSRFELLHFRIQRRGFERPDERLARLRRIDNGVHPEARRSVARVRLALVSRADGLVKLLLFLLAQLLALALELLDLDLDQRPGRRVAAHHGVARRGPGKDEARVVGLPAHGVVAGAEAAAADDGDLRHHAV